MANEDLLPPKFSLYDRSSTVAYRAIGEVLMSDARDVRLTPEAEQIAAIAASRVQKDIDQVKAAAKEAEDNLLIQSTIDQSKLMAELNKFDR